MKILECVICRVFIFVFGILFCLAATAIIFINPLLNGIVKPAIIDSLNKDKANTFSIANIHFIPSLNTMFISNLSFARGDSTNNFVVKTSCISVEGINWLKLIAGSGYSFTELLIEKPVIIIKHQRGKINNETSTSKSNESWGRQLSGLLPEELKSLKVSKVIIHSGKFVQQNKTEEESIIDTINNFSFNISDFAPSDSSKELSSFEDFNLKIEGFHRRWEKSGYDFLMGDIETSSEKSI